jgi:hypothetical protein
MEKIRILKTELTSIGFNINIFVDSLLHVGESIPGLLFDPIEAWSSAELFQVIIRDRQLFTFEAKDIFIIRQLLATGYFVIEQSQDDEQNVEIEALSTAIIRPRDVQIKSDAARIRLDRIALGTLHNIPANKDFEVKRIASSPYYEFHIGKLDDVELRQLLTKAEMLYDVKLARPYIDSQPSRKVETFKYDPVKILSTANPYNVGSLNKYFRNKLYCEPTKSFDIFMSRLYFSGLLEILRELVNKKDAKIDMFLESNDRRKIAKNMKFEIYERMNERTNLFNLLVNKMKKSVKSYESILEKISTLGVSDIATLMSVVTKADRDKLAKLINVGLPAINNCSHNAAFQIFYNTRNKEEKYSELASLKSEYIRHDEVNHVFRCKKCDQFLYCEHNVAFDNAATVGLRVPSETKGTIAEQFRNTLLADSNGTVFCKYCGEKIHRYENDEIIDGSIFNAMVHARSLESNGTSELSIVKNESYSAIRKVLDSFIFKYEINRTALIRDIQNIILYFVLNDLSTLRIKAEDDHFNGYAQMVSAVYTFIYMMDLYTRDPNILMKDTKSGTKLNINEYASEFANRVSQLYRYVTSDPELLSKIIKSAYVTMRSESRSEISIITDKDIALQIVGNPYFKFLYYLYNIEKPTGKTLDVANAFHNIVKSDITKEFFLVRAYAPTAAKWKDGFYKFLAETYDLNINFTNPSNSIFIDSVETQYDPTTLYRRLAVIEKRESLNRKLIYRDILFRNEKRTVFKAMPVCYVYDDSLNAYEWVPVIENKKAVDYVSGDAKLSKIKCDDAKSAALLSRISPDKRTRPLGKFKIEKVTTIKEEVGYHKDIPFSIIKKIGQSFSINQVKYIGLSGGVSYPDFNKGSIPLPIPYELGAMKLESYIKYFIRQYNSLKYNSSRNDNLKYFEQSGLLSKISQYTPDHFPDLNPSKLFATMKSSIKDRYVQMQEYFIDSIDKLLKSGDPVLRLFVVETATAILNIDKTYCTSETYIAENSDAVIDDEDAIGNNDQAEEVDEEDEGFVDTDYIDYEENEDEEHDPVM